MALFHFIFAPENSNFCNTMDKFNLEVRGVIYALFPQYDHADPRGEEMVNQTVQRLKQLDEERPQVILVPEPENMEDPNAIRVYCEGSPIGYVAHEQAAGAQRLFDASTPIVPARIVRVEVERKGNFYIEADVPESARRQPTPKGEAVNAWKDWQCNIPKLPITDGWKSCQVLELLIESQFPVRTLEQVKNLKTYLKLWIDKSLPDFSVEAMQLRKRYVERLRGMGSGALEAEVKRLKKQYVGICCGQRMTYRMQWWQELQQSRQMKFYWNQWRCSRKEDNLWRDLYMVDTQLRRMPGGLYAHIGDLACFFAVLRYRDDVTRSVLWDIYTLLLLRERICHELGIAMKPLPMDAYGVQCEAEDTYMPELADTRMPKQVDDDELCCPFTQEQLKASGIKMHPEVVLSLMQAFSSQYMQKVDWLSFYSVLLRRRWVDDNLSAWCRMVQSLFGLSLDHRTLSRVLKKDGADYTTWTNDDDRILRRKQFAADFDTRLTVYFERKRAKLMEGIRY